MLTPDTLPAFAERFLAPWNEQNVEKVVAVYTPDVIYKDPNTRGEVKGADSLRHYLTKLFAAWKMTWAFKEGYPFSNKNGAAVLWHATIKKADGDKIVEIDGMDLVILQGEKICRNEVYFDRALLAPLI